MISKVTSKYILSLQQKKYRYRYRTFLVEGAKSVAELLQSDFETELLLATNDFLLQNTGLISNDIRTEIVSETELQRLGTFETNNSALAVAKMRSAALPQISEESLILALDEVRDPGNLGTIIRIADWYGIRNIVCSSGCADFYNPKVIAASMGSFCRIHAHYFNLPHFLKENHAATTIYAAALEGNNVYKESLKPSGILVMGNEANGISDEVMHLAHTKLTIPRFGEAESLNVAIATAILCDHFHRQS